MKAFRSALFKSNFQVFLEDFASRAPLQVNLAVWREVWTEVERDGELQDSQKVTAWDGQRVWERERERAWKKPVACDLGITSPHGSQEGSHDLEKEMRAFETFKASKIVSFLCLIVAMRMKMMRVWDGDRRTERNNWAQQLISTCVKM